MLSLIEQIKSGALWDFPGGVHPPENKLQSLNTPIARASIAHELVLPVKQHIGQPGNLIVSVGERVLKGQPLTKYDTSFMLPIHAPTSGTITAIEPRTTAHPSGLSELCIVIQPDSKEEWIERNVIEDYQSLTPEALIEIIRQAGISGMGGAGFPTAKKIQSGLGRTEILIVNAAECEPYITADDVLMQHYANAIVQGIEIVEHILKPKLTIIGIEDNKPQAIKALEQAAEHKDIVIRVIPTKYPSGGEKQLIKVLTNKEVPNTGIPADIGLMVQNVGSLYAIQRAVLHGEPLIERIVTLTGNTFAQPQNVWTLIGTPVQSLLDEFNYSADKKAPRLIMGGPMMGFTLPHTNVPITKTANCILAPTSREISVDSYEMACIRCGQCAEACPASLLPQQLQWHAKAQEFDKCEQLNLKDCIECGACAFVCPSEIPLVKYYRQAKAEIRIRKEEAEASDRAKVRFENKKARLERDKAERENRFKKAADDRRKEMKDSGGDDAIAAAIARVKAQQADKPQETGAKPAVAAAIARAKAKQAAAMQQGQAEPDNSEMAKLREERKRQARERKAEKSSEPESNDKKDAVAATIARAKAKKEQQANASDAPAGDDKKAAVAAAIARAKARKAEQVADADQAEAVTSTTSADEDPKKAAVAAAIARAKARKTEQAASTEQSEAVTSTTAADEDPKKAAVAAAIARAKARKAEQASDAGQAEVVASPAATDEDPKKAAVAAAIARAKARKAEQASDAGKAEVVASSTATDEDPKKAAVAAAIARAKARKAAQQAQASESATPDNSKASPSTESASIESAQVEEDPKKAAVAAAIARAKARKAQQEQQKQSEEKE